MFKPKKTITALAIARLKARLDKAEAAHAEGTQQIERERFDKLQQVHEEHDAKHEALTNQLVESVIGPEPTIA